MGAIAGLRRICRKLPGCGALWARVCPIAPRAQRQSDVSAPCSKPRSRRGACGAPACSSPPRRQLTPAKTLRKQRSTGSKPRRRPVGMTTGAPLSSARGRRAPQFATGDPSGGQRQRSIFQRTLELDVTRLFSRTGGIHGLTPRAPCAAAQPRSAVFASACRWMSMVWASGNFMAHHPALH